MKSLKSLWKIFLVATVSFALGALVFRTPIVKAQSGANVSIELVPLLGLSSTLHARGSQVVGFSCATKDGEPECYVASVR
jgi:hypothetical protein